MMDPVTIFERLRGMAARILLHSARDDYGHGGTSIVAAQPVQLFVVENGQATIRTDRGRVVDRLAGKPLPCLQAWLSSFPSDAVAMGYIGYESGQYIEDVPALAQGQDAPDVVLGRYDWHVRISETVDMVGSPPKEIVVALEQAAQSSAGKWHLGEWRCDVSDEQYFADIRRIKHYIESGDVYQVNYARRFVVPVIKAGDVASLYRKAHAASSASFGALLDLPGVQVLSLSPELFLRRQEPNGRLETRPIKGTNRREIDLSKNQQAKRALRVDSKEMAEHLMIVDLLRNDLGRIARIGSVSVDDYAAVVEFPKVNHLVSTISCQPISGVSVVDLLRATFPGGSITGAPKIRAQEIIAELEPSRRGPYCGSIGAMWPDGRLSLSIAIRTATIVKQEVRLHFGGGIVHDSIPERELAETEEKAAAWREALQSS